MRVFVAGGSGAVGRQMVPRLIAAGHAVRAITRQADRSIWLREAGADAHICDVFDRERLIAIVRDAAPDAIVHQLTDLPAAMNPRKLDELYDLE